MKIVSTDKVNTPAIAPDTRIAECCDISQTELRDLVEYISVPRNRTHERESNVKIATWAETQFVEAGFQTVRQGHCDNIYTMLPESCEQFVLIGAHYDSVPGTPGADDNGSAVAAMIGCSRAVANYQSRNGVRLPVMFVAFNREEEKLAGSLDFVANFMPTAPKLIESHVLEMVGYCDHTPGSQRLPNGIPIKLPRDAGDFLAIVCNRTSNSQAESLIECARSYTPDLPVLGLKVFLGMEKVFKDLLRSDHSPFWSAGYPSTMWTDTSEFRNANYHGPDDTPDTLDYEFLQQVTRLVSARTILAASRL